jgi:hypothetical protein
LWCNTQWANLSIQAKKFDLPTLPYFDPKTGLLSKDVNHKLWSLIVSLLHLLYRIVTAALSPRLNSATRRDKLSVSRFNTFSSLQHSCR